MLPRLLQGQSDVETGKGKANILSSFALPLRRRRNQEHQTIPDCTASVEEFEVLGQY